PLVERGIHGLVRHPSESGNLAAAFGAAGLLGSFAGLAIAALGLLPLVLHRIRIEDRLLFERHGEAFDRYRRRVGALFPRPRSRPPAASSARGAIGKAASPSAGSGDTGACGRAIRGSGWVD
ncbi:MAG: isoprenylcysteine carboxylmethyltransferase family protein, partial [Isosphaeraceae bacterium]